MTDTEVYLTVGKEGVCRETPHHLEAELKWYLILTSVCVSGWEDPDSMDGTRGHLIQEILLGQ